MKFTSYWSNNWKSSEYCERLPFQKAAFRFSSRNKILVPPESLFLKGEILGMKKILAIIIMLPLSLTLWAQGSNPLRLEIAAPAGSDPFNYVTNGKKGVCIFYPTSNETGKDSISWSFLMVDEKLKEVWHKLVPLHKDVIYLKSLSTDNAIYLLFHDTKRNKDGNIFVYMIVPRLQLITEHRGMIPDKAEVVDFEIANSFAFIGYNNRKDQPGIIGFSLVTGEKRNYAITSEKDALLLDIAVDTTRRAIFATYKIQFSSSRNHLLVNQYNSPGALEKTLDFSEQVERRNFNSAQYIPLGEGKGLVAGTYGYTETSSRRQYDYYDNYYNNYYYNYSSPYFLRQSNYDANDDKSPVSDGYFTAQVNNGVAAKMNYYNFSEFTNAIKYITDASVLRIRSKAGKRSDKPGESGSANNADEKERTLNLRLLTHELLVNNGQFIIVSEAYSPEYHTNTQMSYDYYGRAFPTSYQIFDGYRYSHAFVAGFDSSGIMAWNNGMEMRDILTKYLNRKLNCLFENEETVLFYNANNKVAFKTIKGNAIVDNTSYTPLTPARGTDQPIDEYQGTIDHWYDDYFIATGYQTIRNNYLESNKRNVFYMSKMAFR